MDEFELLPFEFLLILYSQKFVRLSNLVDVFEHFYDLRHNNDPFDYFLENVGDLYDNLLLDSYLYRWSFDLLYDLDDSFDMVDIFDDLFHLLENGYFLDHPLNLHDLWPDGVYRYDLLLFDLNFFDSLDNPGHLYDLFDNFLNVLVYSDNLGNNPFDFDDLGNLYQFRNHFLHFVDSRNYRWTLDNLFDDLLRCDNLLNLRLDGYYFLDNRRDLLYDFLDVGNDFLNLSDSLVYDNLLNNFLDVFDL